MNKDESKSVVMTGENNIINDNVNVKNKTREQILAEADEIYVKWKKMCKERGVKKVDINDEKSDAKLDEIFEILQKEHEDFAIAYPIQLRYLAQLGQYNHTAMDIFLRKIETTPWKSEEEYIEYQAKYAQLVYMKTHNRYTRQELTDVYEKAKFMLKRERLAFKEQVERAQKQIDKEEEGLKNQKRQDMMELVKKRLAEMKMVTESGVTVETISDD